MRVSLRGIQKGHRWSSSQAEGWMALRSYSANRNEQLRAQVHVLKPAPALIRAQFFERARSS